jgi:hypothetical protein
MYISEWAWHSGSMIISVGKTEETCYGVTFIHQEIATLLPNNETKATQ